MGEKVSMPSKSNSNIDNAAHELLTQHIKGRLNENEYDNGVPNEIY